MCYSQYESSETFLNHVPSLLADIMTKFGASISFYIILFFGILKFGLARTPDVPDSHWHMESEEKQIVQPLCLLDYALFYVYYCILFFTALLLAML